jgi:hypothetical protein
MVQKIKNYAHQEQYSHLADINIMKDAIKNKQYPFDPDRPFKINVLDIHKNRDIFPSSLYENLNMFDDLISD